jgi:hypothetical protein
MATLVSVLVGVGVCAGRREPLIANSITVAATSIRTPLGVFFASAWRWSS